MKSHLIFIFLFFSSQSLLAQAKNHSIDTEHLKTITGNEDVLFVPVETKSLPPTEEQEARGIKGRLLISWGQIQFGDIDTSFHRYDQNGDEVSEDDVDYINQYIANNLEQVRSHLVSIEYLVTDHLSIELADNYREYGLDGETVGEEGDSGLLFDPMSSTNPWKLDHFDKIHDIQLGINYNVNIVKTKHGGLDLSLRGSGGLVHLDTRTSANYTNGGSETLHEYNGLAGYSMGAGVRARFTHRKFFVQGGVDYRRYVIAPTRNEDGTSQEIHQEGFMFYLGIGVRF